MWYAVFPDRHSFFQPTEATKGTIHAVEYYSTTMNETRRMQIYLPFEYDIKEFISYPVLYLQHGGGDDETGWEQKGNVKAILDEKIASCEAIPMIVVMPNGQLPVPLYKDELINDIIPYIEKNYRVRADKDNRALAGLSMGGLQVLDTGLRNTDLFAYLGVFSSGWFREDEATYREMGNFIQQNRDRIKENVRYFYFSEGGPEDIAYENGQATRKVLENNGIDLIYRDHPGGHTWPVWEKNLGEILPYLFQTVPGMTELHSFTPDPVIPSEEEVEYFKDVVYMTRDGMDLTLQILKPVGGKGKIPCVVFVQGSAWMKQYVYANVENMKRFASKGYVVAIVEYRPSMVAPFPAQMQDAKTAIRYMRKQAEEYGIDTHNIFLWGDSSGGHTVLMVGVTENMPEMDTPDYNEYSAHVNAVIDYYGCSDVEQMQYTALYGDRITDKSPEGLLIGGKNVREHMEDIYKTSTVRYMSPDRPLVPFLIMHGSADKTVPFHQSYLQADAMRKQGHTYQLYKLTGADHGTPEFWSREAFDLVDHFIRINMK
ncbi:MAG: prolyl oligopeptidase family serine peptidase [Tannerellaceae bacterium]|nr:prolyl oligopeptidase family serine peptidase [Tannerellaceae bacterium]